MKTYVINLGDRKSRLVQFYNNFPKSWPLAQPIVYNAIDGKKCIPPSWWKQGCGSWGCYKSHLNIIENHLLNNSDEDLLILEDDAIFCENFISKFHEFIDNVPIDADQIYIGGQHLSPPIQINDNIYRATNINRTHAYIITKKGLQYIYRILNENQNWNPKFHIDHYYGQNHKNNIIAYAPKEWLCGQRGDIFSDICHKIVKERWWFKQNKEITISPELQKNIFVVVLGLHRSGSSCISMILHKLGVNMGDNLSGYENYNGGGGEAPRLAQICEQAATFPSTTITYPDIVQNKLADWITQRISKASSNNTIAGGKYPHLCSMGDQLINILGNNLRIVHCDRSLEDSIDSLKRRSKKCRGWLNITDEQAENVQKWLWDNKQIFLNKVSQDKIYNIKYEDLHNNTKDVVDGLIKFLDIHPSPDQIQNAINHVKPK